MSLPPKGDKPQKLAGILVTQGVRGKAGRFKDLQKVFFQVELTDWRLVHRLLDLLVLENCEAIRARKLPRLYASGVRYRKPFTDANGTQRLQSAVETFARKEGTCPDLATWRAAELRVLGDPAIGVRPCRFAPNGRCVSHPPVARPNDRVIVRGCPSIKMYRRPEFPGLFHCETRLPNGDAEDQSRFLGMGNARE